MIRRRNLVDRALSEDLKNDAIRNATMVISGISAANHVDINQSSKNNVEKIILDLLEYGKKLSVGRITAMSDLPYSEIRKELKILVTNGVLKEIADKDGASKYYLP